MKTINTKTNQEINTQVVYIHTRNDKPGHVFYVGAGNIQRPYNKHSRNKYWEDIVKRHGYNVHIIKTNLTVEDAIALEVKLTLAYKSIGMAEARTQIGYLGNKEHSNETRQKISIAHKGKIVSDETKLKMSIASKGKIVSNETKLKMSNAQKGRVVSDETRQKISIGRKGKIFSNENRQKCSVAKKIQAYIKNKIVGNKIISSFNNLSDASFITGISSSGISSTCHEKQKTSGIYDLKNKKFVSLTHAQLKESPNCKRVSWRFI